MFIELYKFSRFVMYLNPCLMDLGHDTSNLISEVLHVLRVVHPNYPGCDHLRTMSRDKLLSQFCERPSIWVGNKTPHARTLQKVRASLTW